MHRKHIEYQHPPHTRELILDEAENLIALKGVFGFHLKSIAEPLSIKVPAIYKHYKSRDDLLIAVSRRFIHLLSQQFQYDPDKPAKESMRLALDEFVDFKVQNPAYVRIALVDFATPAGGMEYIKLAAGGTFQENFATGPLSAMHKRLKGLLLSGITQGVFRHVDELELYRVVYGDILLQLTFPDDSMLTSNPSTEQIDRVKESLNEIISKYLYL